MAWQDYVQQVLEERSSRRPYEHAYHQTDTYGQNLLKTENLQEKALGGAWKVGVPAALGYGVYQAYGLGGLAVFGGLYGAKKGFDFARHAYAQGHADRIYERLQGRGLDTARKYANAGYNRAAKNFKWHPGYWARQAAGGTLRAAGRGAIGAVRGVAGALPSLAVGAGFVGGKIAKGAWDTLRITESVARTALTGGKGGVRPGMSAWFPYYNSLPKGDFRRFAMNPRVGTRVAIGAVALGLISGAGELLTQRHHGPPPTVFYDGVSVHHVDEMGANAEYAAKVLGPNSAYARSLTPFADDAAMMLGRAALIR